MNALNSILFIALPYVALAVFIIGTLLRYRTTAFQVSSLSSEFLEGKKLFWGSVPFHWGIITLFFGHLIAFLVPSGVLAWNAHPVRLLIIEVSAFVFALSMLAGILNLIFRRVTDPRVSVVSNWMDFTVLGLLLLQVITGLTVAYTMRWGSSWFAAVLTPYLWSIFTFSPEIAAISAMNWLLQLHVVGAFLILLIIPFSRLVHLLVFPFQYIWRPYQRVMWNWNRKSVRSPGTVWTQTRPKNN